MKRFFLMTVLLLSALGMTFADTYYDSQEEFDREWNAAANKYSFVCIAIEEADDGDGTFACDGTEEDGYLSYYYEGTKACVYAIFSNSMEIISEYLEDEEFINKKWFTLRKQKEKAVKYWERSIERVNIETITIK